MEKQPSSKSDIDIPILGERAALSFEAAVTDIGRIIVDSVSLEEVKEIMQPLPCYDAFKLKSKYDDLLLDSSSEDIHQILFESRFIQRLNMIKELEQNASSTLPAWRPNEVKSDIDLYRPHRVKFLKKQIEKLEEEVLKQEKLLESFKIGCKTFVEFVKMEKQETLKNKIELTQMREEIESTSVTMDEE